MTDWPNRAALQATVQTLRQELEQVCLRLEAAGDPRSGAGGTWTIVDTIAHLTSWRLTTAARLEAGLAGESPLMPWPAPLDETEDLDEINRWFFESNRAKPLADVLHESRATFDRVERAIAALPDRELLEPGHFPWLAGEALGPAVIEGTREHHAEHRPEFQASLSETD